MLPLLAGSLDIQNEQTSWILKSSSLFTSEITVRTLPFIFLKFPWKLKLYWTIFASCGNANFISGDLEVIFNSTLVSLVFHFLESEKRHIDIGFLENVFLVPFIQRVLLFLSLRDLPWLCCNKKEHYSFSTVFKEGTLAHWCYWSGEEGGFESVNSQFCCLVL